MMEKLNEKRAQLIAETVILNPTRAFASLRKLGFSAQGTSGNLGIIKTLSEALLVLEQRAEAAEVEKAGAEERCRMMFDAKTHWAERARVAEAKLAPDGWRLVPDEMTKEMWLQAHTLCDATCPDCGKGFAVDVTDNIQLSWGDMLASAPSPTDTL